MSNVTLFPSRFFQSSRKSSSAIECEIGPATALDFEFVARNLRPEDAAEAYAACMASPEMAALECQRHATLALAGRVGGETICVFGVSRASALLEYGMPWMMGTTGVERHAVTFLRNSRPVVEVMLDAYPMLVNYVDARNFMAVRWLEWLGFKVEEPQPHGPFKRPFHRFHMERAS